MGGFVGNNCNMISTHVLDGASIESDMNHSLRSYPHYDPVGVGCEIGGNFRCARGLVLGSEVVIGNNVQITVEDYVIWNGATLTDGTVV
jgi:NDP-sugar pyrophosphorylase family protein